MTDLTKKYQNCELPEGWYYIKDENGQIIIAEYSAYCIDKETNETECDWSCSSEPEQVLAEVPDYIEWRNMVNCACEEHEANKHFIDENQQLKELLKECRPYFNALVEKRLKLEYIPQVYELLTKIDEVLK